MLGSGSPESRRWKCYRAAWRLASGFGWCSSPTWTSRLLYDWCSINWFSLLKILPSEECAFYQSIQVEKTSMKKGVPGQELSVEVDRQPLDIVHGQTARILHRAHGTPQTWTQIRLDISLFRAYYTSRWKYLSFMKWSVDFWYTQLYLFSA